MTEACPNHGCGTPTASPSPPYRRVLWAALLINAAMFGIELAGGWHAESVSVLADAGDFFGDSINYGLSLLVMTMASTWRARAALFKGVTMGVFGIFILARAVWFGLTGSIPAPTTMGAIGALALLANVSVAAMLFAWRDGDANRRSVWLCSRNDALGNLAVMFAALGIFGTGSNWPDLVVAAAMSVMALSAFWSVVRQAGAELRAVPAKL